MFIYHFNRLIRNKYVWGVFAVVVSFTFVATDVSCWSTPQDGMTAGKLNGKRITSDQFTAVQNAIRGFGRNRDSKTPGRVIDRRAWEQIAACQTAAAQGFESTEKEVQDAIREMPVFQGPNGFEYQRYRQVLADQDLTPKSYEHLIRNQIALMKMASLVETAGWIMPMEIDEELAAQTDRFNVQVASVHNAFARKDMRLTDANYKKYYEENKASFALPDQIAVRYFAIPVTNYLAKVTVSEDSLHDYYDANADKYMRTVPQTNKLAGATNAPATDVKEPIPFAEVRPAILAELQLEEARYCAETNVTFLVYGYRGETNANELASIGKLFGAACRVTELFSQENPPASLEDNAKNFAQTAFDLDPAREDSRFGIVKGSTSVYVIERVKSVPAHTPSFADILPAIKVRAQEKARAEAFESYAKELRNDIQNLMKQGKSFADAAIEKKLNVSTSVTFTVHDVAQTKFPNRELIAYGSAMLKKGEISDPLPASELLSLLVYVKDRQPGDALVSDMIRNQLRSAISRRKAGPLFIDWLSWNLGRQDFKPVQSLAAADETTGISDSDDPDAPLEAPAKQAAPAAKAPAAKK